MPLLVPSSLCKFLSVRHCHPVLIICDSFLNFLVGLNGMKFYVRQQRKARREAAALEITDEKQTLLEH